MDHTIVDMRDKKLAALKQTLEVERAQQTDIDVLLREVESKTINVREQCEDVSAVQKVFESSLVTLLDVPSHVRDTVAIREALH